MAHSQSDSGNFRACLLMTGGMAAFAFEDLFLKRSAMGMPPGQVLAMVGAAGALIFGIAARLQGHPILSRRAFDRSVLARNFGEATASMTYIVALALLPLTLNAALLQASPLVVTIAAALFLGERVRWRRWTAVLVGLLGILIILRPGLEGFQWAALLTIACVLLITVRDIATRVVPKDIGTMQLTTWAYLTIVPAGVALMAFQGHAPVMPSPGLWTYLAAALVTGVVGYWAVTAAMRAGEASVVAPFRYSRLVFSVGLAMIFLGESPDRWTILGSVLVIGSGLYTLAREARLRTRTSPRTDQPL